LPRREAIRNDQGRFMWPISKKTIGIILTAGRRYSERSVGIDAIHPASLYKPVMLGVLNNAD
jgi:hypothetical protein